jgi:NAD-dependent dihydropyrimidine dehydrogenase PreA subunit
MKYLTNVVTLELMPERCTGCGRCLEVCPREVFGKNGKTVRIVDRDLCIECGACMMNCSFNAIRVNAGVGCAAAIINGLIKGGEPECGCGGNDASDASCC